MKLTATIRPRSAGEIRGFLVGLALADYEQISTGQVPTVYAAAKKLGIVYKREGRGVENWLTAQQVIDKGDGDCEDLAAYWTASTWWELVKKFERRGMGARAAFLRAFALAEPDVVRTGPSTLHAVGRFNGKIFDPSKKLGMGKGKDDGRR